MEIVSFFFALFLLLGQTSSGSVAPSTDAYGAKVNGLLLHWHNYIVWGSSSDSSPGWNSEYYRTLFRMGPNILPEVVEMYRSEKDPRVLYCLETLFGHASRFEIYRYTSTPHKVMGKEMMDNKKDLPALSIDTDRLDEFRDALFIRDMSIKWWDKRGDFLKRKRASVRKTITDIVGKDKSERTNYDWDKYRNLGKKVFPYGIYNIPYYIDEINNDNDPIILYKFLQITNYPEYGRLHMTGNVSQNFKRVQNAYPALDDKLKLIRQWWSDNKQNYNRLPDLYQAIDAAVKKIGE